MDRIKKYPPDFAKAFAPSIKFLSYANTRILTEDETKFSKFCKFFLILPSIAVFYVTAVIHVFELLLQKQIFLVAYLLPPMLICTQAIVKGGVIIPNMNEASALLKELGDLWKTTNLTKIQEKKKSELLNKINFCNSALYWVSLVGTFQYLISPLVETLVRKFILKQDCEFLLPVYCSFPLNSTNNWISYILVYVFQVTCMFLCIFVYVGAELLMVTLCSTLAIEFAVLREDLLKVEPVEKHMDASSYKNGQYTITDFVKTHQRLIELGRQLDDVFNPMVFSDLLFVGITTCFFRYAAQFSRGPTYMANNYVAVFSSLTFVLYLCYSGELLLVESAGVGETAYSTEWFKGDRCYQRKIWFIIKRSQTPCCLTSLKYSTITLNMFTKVISTTWSYFSLMNTVYGEEN